MASQIPSLTMNDGLKIPILGLGTYQGFSKLEEAKQAVLDAIDAGYRHFDCAPLYGNEKGLGEAFNKKIADGVVKREELFIVSKLWWTDLEPERVLPALKGTLANMGLDYLDLYLIHWPMGFKEGGADPIYPKDEFGKPLFSDADYVDTWPVMEEAVQQGLTRSIGLSNFNKSQIERVLKCINIPPAMLQIESSPYLPQCKLTQYCKSKGIAVTVYSPLGAGMRPWKKEGDKVLIADPRILSMAAKYNKTPAQLLIKYQVQRDLVCIPKSVTKSRILANSQVFDFELSAEDLEGLTSLDCNERTLVISEHSDHPHYPFNAEY